MKQSFLAPAIVVMTLATGGLSYAQSSTAVGNNSGAAGTNNTSPGTTGSGNAPAERMGGSTALGNPGGADTANPGLGTAATAPGHTDGSNNAVSTGPQNNAGAPVPGANSFTEGQARSRIQDKGFSQVTDLKRDDQGVWRGKAQRDGKSVSVALDYQGNVVAQ